MDLCFSKSKALLSAQCIFCWRLDCNQGIICRLQLSPLELLELGQFSLLWHSLHAMLTCVTII